METLEHLVQNERTTFGRVVKKLKEENRQLMQQVTRYLLNIFDSKKQAMKRICKKIFSTVSYYSH